VIRRDSAEKEVWFRTTPGPQRGKVQVELDLAPSLRAVYAIDLETDVVDQIEFLKDASPVGRLVFTYLQDSAAWESVRLTYRSPGSGSQINDTGLLWLADLISGSLGQ